MAGVPEDHREGRRRVDVTLGLHLDSDDVDSTTEEVVAGLRAHLEGASFVSGTQGVLRADQVFVIDHVDEPVHVHSIKFGKGKS